MNGLLMTTEILFRYELFVNTSSDYNCVVLINLLILMLVLVNISTDIIATKKIFRKETFIYFVLYRAQVFDIAVRYSVDLRTFKDLLDDFVATTVSFIFTDP